MAVRKSLHNLVRKLGDSKACKYAKRLRVVLGMCLARPLDKRLETLTIERGVDMADEVKKVAKKRGRTKKSVDECRRAYTEAQNLMGLEDCVFSFVADPKDKSKVETASVVKVTKDESGNIAGMETLVQLSGNTFCDALRTALCIGWQATRLVRGSDAEKPAPVVETDPELASQ